MVDPAGAVGRAVPAGQILVPGFMALEGDSLRWELEKPHMITPEKVMLNDFVQLWNKQPLSVLSFANRWGVLALDEHNRPCAENMEAGRDPLEAWRFFSRRAMAVLNLIAALKQKKLGDLDDWKQLGASDRSREEHFRKIGVARQFPLPQFGFPDTIERAGRVIGSELNSWMAVWRKKWLEAPSDFRVDNVGAGLWEVQIDFHGGLFPAIAFQLCLVAADADSLYCCSGCGYPYIRPRDRKRPRPGHANYCPECVELGIPVRRASERYRERKANAKTTKKRK
jgi:hypothetical protein